MKNIIFSIILLLSYAFVSCGGKNDPLTQQKLDAYLASFKALKTELPEMLNQSNAGNINTKDQSYGNFEEILKKNGLTASEYAMINAKVGAIFSTLNSGEFIKEMQKMKDDGMVQMDDGMKEMQAQLDNPDVPEESKIQIRKAMEEMKTAKGQINDEFEKNKKFADKVLDKTKSITNQFISKDDIELVKKNLSKIQETYTGGIIPTNFNVK